MRHLTVSLLVLAGLGPLGAAVAADPAIAPPAGSASPAGGAASIPFHESSTGLFKPVTVTAAPEPALLAKAKELMDLMHLEAQLRDQADLGFDAQVGPIRDQLKEQPEAMRKAFEEGIVEVRELVRSKVDWSTIVDGIASSYARSYSASELDGLLAFYRSPLGRRVVELTPVLGRDQMLATQQPMADLMPEIQQILVKHLGAAEASGKGAELAAAGIEPGKPFPALAGTDLDGKPFDLAAWKGKVVLVDFWATWCGPCVHEMPNVIADYRAYHAQGFEVVGVSLDEDKEALTAFIAEKKMPWPQLFDGKGWQNDIAVTFSIHSIPAPFLIGRDGNLIAANLRGDDLKSAIEKALADNPPAPAP